MTDMVKVVQISYISALRWDEEAGVWLGWAPGIDVFSQGSTPEEASKALHGALDLVFNRCMEKGILERTLEDSGFVREAAADPERRDFVGMIEASVIAKQTSGSRLRPMMTQVGAVC